MDGVESFVGLIRGVNVGGKNLLKMADLREMLLEVGLLEPRTLLQSGNFVFRTESALSSQLEDEDRKSVV